MTERWKTQLERFERLNPADDLVERARHRLLRPLPSEGVGRRAGAIVVATILTVGLAVGGYVIVSDRSTPTGTGVSAPPEVVENGDLLFAASLENGWHIYTVDPDTGEERELTNGVRDYGSDWSPDGTKIVYDSEGDAGYQIVIADADGSNPVPIATGESPAWSPDGTRIAYSGEDGSIWVVNADGSDAHPVTAGAAAGEGEGQDAAFDWNPAWSPDGSAIAYTRTVAHRYAEMPNSQQRTDVALQELRIWNEVDDTDMALTDAYTHLGGVDWSPDGSTLVFTGAPTLFHEETTNGIAWPRVLTIPSSGGEVAAITPERERWIGGATWSPDGDWIAFQDDYETIAMIRPDGSDRTEIDLGYEVIGLSWGVSPSPEA